MQAAMEHFKPATHHQKNQTLPSPNLSSQCISNTINEEVISELVKLCSLQLLYWESGVKADQSCSWPMLVQGDWM